MLASNEGITLLLYVSIVSELETKVFDIELLNFVFVTLCGVGYVANILYI